MLTMNCGQKCRSPTSINSSYLRCVIFSPPSRCLSTHSIFPHSLSQLYPLLQASTALCFVPTVSPDPSPQCIDPSASRYCEYISSSVICVYLHLSTLMESCCCEGEIVAARRTWLVSACDRYRRTFFRIPFHFISFRGLFDR